MWIQYTIMNNHGVTNTYSMWILHLQIHMFHGVQSDQFHIQTTVLFGIGQIIGGGGVMGRLFLG